jgi:hypothetical protein
VFRIDNEYRLVMHGSLFLLFIVVGNDAVGVVVLILAEVDRFKEYAFIFNEQ